MAYVAVIGDAPTQQRSTRRHTVKLRFRFGMMSLSFVTVALAAVLSILYFMQVNQLTMSGYAITKLETDIKNVKESNRKLQYEISQHNALNVINTAASNNLHMVPAEQLQFWWQGQDDYLATNQSQ